MRGRDGRTLAEAWDGSPQAYLGTTVAGFPNLFLLLGPNTGLGHNSIVFMIESQFNYVLDALRLMRARGGADASRSAPEAQARLQRAHPGAHARHGLDRGRLRELVPRRQGRNTTLWPDFTWPFRERTRRLDPAHYELRAPRPGARARGRLTARAARAANVSPLLH